MKSILISIRPEWVAKILNGEKTIEIRKTAPKCDLPIDVYIYCTRTIKPLSDYDWGDFTFDDLPKLGKVVAKFRLKKVERIISCIVSEWGDDPWEKRPALRLEETDDDGWDWHFIYDSGSDGHYGELHEYLGFPFHGYGRPKDFEEGKTFGYAWHISDLEIFDEPKPLSEFGLKRAPQSYCYVEVEE